MGRAQVEMTSGDALLGGSDFDEALCAGLKSVAEAAAGEKLFDNSPANCAALLAAACSAKEALSEVEQLVTVQASREALAT